MQKKILIILLFLTLSHAPLFAETENIVVNTTVGQPQILRETKIIPAQPGTKCRTGDVLMTPSAGCSLDISVNGLAGCRVLPTSEFVITDGSKSDMRVQIKTGNAIMNLEKLPADSTFRVETPTAVATVRGTQFWGRVQPVSTDNPMTTFAVREGTVNVLDKKTGEIFSLKKNQAIDIAKDGSRPPVIRPALDGEMKAMEQASGIKTSA